MRPITRLRVNFDHRAGVKKIDFFNRLATKIHTGRCVHDVITLAVIFQDGVGDPGRFGSTIHTKAGIHVTGIHLTRAALRIRGVGAVHHIGVIAGAARQPVNAGATVQVVVVAQ